MNATSSCDEIDDRPVFAQLLQDAGAQFQVIACYANDRWARNVPVAHTSLARLRQRHVWWATADGLWDIDKVQQDGYNLAFVLDIQVSDPTVETGGLREQAP